MIYFDAKGLLKGTLTAKRTCIIVITNAYTLPSNGFETVEIG